jgi:RHS repeat-associated protein
MPGKLYREIKHDDTFMEYAYDQRGNLSGVTDFKGNITTYEYDALNRLTKVTQPGNIITLYTYDIHGNLATVTDGVSNTTSYRYDDMGRLLETTSPDTGLVKYAYDEAGNIKTKEDAKGIVVQYAYDNLNRLTNVQYPDSSQNISYTYDQGTNSIGFRSGMTDQSGTMNFGYDARGRLTDKISTISGHTYPISRAYTPGGRVSLISYPTGRTIDYQRGGCACNVSSITTSFAGTTVTLMNNLIYRPFGGVSGMDNGAGGIIGSEKDLSGRLTVSNPGAVHEKTYTYDNNDNLTSISAPSTSWQSRTYGYDAVNRLIHAEGPYGAIDYTYDAVGNRLTKTESSSSTVYTYYPAKNRLHEAVTGAETIAHTFDTNGNITGIGNKTLTYNQDNRLIRVEENGVTLGEYIYNGLGQRIIKNAGGVTTVFHYDFDGNIIAESDSSGSISREYLYKGSSRLAMVDVLAGNMYYYGNDQLGTPQIMTDSTNTVVWEGEYKPFGEADVNPNSTVVNNFRFPGQYYDQGTGLYYNYHRYYDPITGRYVTPDPIGLEGGINLFNYVLNNPVNHIDLLGLSYANNYNRNLSTTNKFFFQGATSATRTAIGLITSGSVAQTFGTVTPLQAIASMPEGIANLGAIGTIGAAAINTAINATLSAIALESGISVGSLVNAIPVYGTDQTIGDWWLDFAWDYFHKKDAANPCD